MAFDIYQAVTDRIIAMMEQGNIPWHKEWVGGGKTAVSYVTRKPYSLLNQLLLGDPGEYITFNQCSKLGGKVKKGEKSRMVVFWKWLDKKDNDGNIVLDCKGNPEQVPMLRYYNVFHIDQCEGIDTKLKPVVLNEDILPIDAAQEVIDQYLDRTGVKLVNVQQDRAFYRPSTDTITLPLMSQFETAESYYATAFHEMAHSTGHETRLNRLTSDAAFGSADYSLEELVAEMGSAYICSTVGIETAATIKNSAAYIQGWLKALRDDKRLIVKAAGRAEKAANLILGRMQRTSEE